MLKFSLPFLLALGACIPHGYVSSSSQKYVVLLRKDLPLDEIQNHHARMDKHLESLDIMTKRQLKDSSSPGFRESKSTIGDVHFHAYEVNMTPELASEVASDFAVELVEPDLLDKGQAKPSRTTQDSEIPASVHEGAQQAPDNMMQSPNTSDGVLDGRQSNARDKTEISNTTSPYDMYDEALDHQFEQVGELQGPDRAPKSLGFPKKVSRIAVDIDDPKELIGGGKDHTSITTSFWREHDVAPTFKIFKRSPDKDSEPNTSQGHTAESSYTTSYEGPCTTRYNTRITSMPNNTKYTNVTSYKGPNTTSFWREHDVAPTFKIFKRSPDKDSEPNTSQGHTAESILNNGYEELSTNHATRYEKPSITHTSTTTSEVSKTRYVEEPTNSLPPVGGPSINDTRPITSGYLEKMQDLMNGLVRARKMYRQYDAPWPLAQLSYRNETDLLHVEPYLYYATGKKHFAYIMDSRVPLSDEDYAGRVSYGADFVSSPRGNLSSEAYDSEDGPGTVVTSKLLGKTRGVAKSAEGIIVIVADHEREISLVNFLKGLHWIINDYTNRDYGRRAVINCSLRVKARKGYRLGVQRAIEAGLLFVDAADNHESGVCNFPEQGPDQYSGKITVGSITPEFTIDPNTNYGRCVDVSYVGNGPDYLPNNDDFEVENEAYYAAPYVSGLALYIWELNPYFTLRETAALIINNKLGAIRGDLRGTPNKVAYNGF